MMQSIVKRSRPMLVLAVALLVGCADSTPSASSAAVPVTDTAPIAAAPPADIAAPVATIDSAEPMAAANSEPSRLAQALPTQASLADGKWQAGKHYTLLSPAQPTNVGPGKVEVIEVFWYGCSHCYELDPYLESWKKNKPAYIEFVRLPVTTRQGIRLVDPRDLSHALFDGELVTLHLTSGPLLTDFSLQDLEDRLPAGIFERVHRQALINLEKLGCLDPVDTGGYTARMHDGDLVPISRQAARRLRRRLGLT